VFPELVVVVVATKEPLEDYVRNSARTLPATLKFVTETWKTAPAGRGSEKKFGYLSFSRSARSNSWRPTGFRDVRLGSRDRPRWPFRRSISA
jgi:hypothetical protein